jgi:hypothetical protein
MQRERQSAPRRWIALLVWLTIMPLYGVTRTNVNINYGFKTGFSSTIYDVRRFNVLQHPVTDYMSRSEISSFYTAFARMNIHRHYVQTECSYNISKYSITSPTLQWDSQAQTDALSTMYTKIIGVEVPLYYGYYIQKSSLYGMSFYMGPKAKFVITDISSHNFDNYPFMSITEYIRPINFSFMVGLGISINPLFFDFSFEYGLHNISNYFETIDLGGIVSTNALILDRRKNVLSFSLGFIF